MLLNLLRLVQVSQERGDDVLAGALPALGVRTGTRGPGDTAFCECDVDLVGRVLAALHLRLELRAPPRHVGHSPMVKVLAAACERLRERELPDLRVRQPQSASHGPSLAANTGFYTAERARCTNCPRACGADSYSPTASTCYFAAGRSNVGSTPRRGRVGHAAALTLMQASRRG